MKIIYVARENADSTEGRGPMVPIAHFLKKEDAELAARGRGVMGYGDGDVKVIPVFESIKDWKDNKKEELRQQALAKLTTEEKRALGLS